MRALVIVPLVIAVPSCWAQMMPMGLTSKSTLLQIPEIQAELKLTAKQLHGIDAKREELRALKNTESLNDMQHPYRTVDPKLVLFLEPAQQKRLQELFVQENGLISLSEKEVSEVLALPKEKQEKALALIDDLMAKVMNHLADLPAGGKPDPKKVEAFKKQAHVDLRALLNDSERTRWARMQGKPFRFPKSMRPHG